MGKIGSSAKTKHSNCFPSGFSIYGTNSLFFVDTGAIYEERCALAVPTNIKTLRAGNAVEWARIEFKETWDAKASLKTICAFANDIDD